MAETIPTALYEVTSADQTITQRKPSLLTSSGGLKEAVTDINFNPPSTQEDEFKQRKEVLGKKIQDALLLGLAALILGWWISATVLKSTRHRW